MRILGDDIRKLVYSTAVVKCVNPECGVFLELNTDDVNWCQIVWATTCPKCKHVIAIKFGPVRSSPYERHPSGFAVHKLTDIHGVM
jgi:hypothetical protein